MIYHSFDEDSVRSPATGRPYGPGPLWAGTEPMDYPEPACVCGGPWVKDRCAMEGTLIGAQFEMACALRDLWLVWVALLRIDRLAGWLTRRLNAKAAPPPERRLR